MHPVAKDSQRTRTSYDDDDEIFTTRPGTGAYKYRVPRIQEAPATVNNNSQREITCNSRNGTTVQMQRHGFIPVPGG